jgi:alpha-tubulin suppressor-like RCC1 family protein
MKNCLRGGLVAFFVCVGLSATHASAATVMKVVGGGAHTCSLNTAGAVQCWGSNTNGQLGDATTTNHSTPVTVSGLASGVTAIAAGYQHTCAVTSAGAVKCWGLNTNGQLGNSSTTLQTSPVQVSGLTSGVVAVSAGYSHTCALTSSGAVSCWGYNVYGQLGDNSTIQRLVPVPVSGLASGVTAISAGWYHTCALVGGSVQCWGYNVYGQLGDGTTTSRSTPWTVSGLSGGILGVVAGGYHACAITVASTMTCWGYNPNGQLGDGSTTNRSTPVVVGNLDGVVEAFAGAGHTCAVTFGGAMLCWGYNYYGQVGNGTNADRVSPTIVSRFPKGVASGGAGQMHTCAVTTGGGVACWGQGTDGELGDGSATTRSMPVTVSTLAGRLGSRAGALAPGLGYHSCAVSTGGAVRCWGYNGSGQLGDASTTTRNTPVSVTYWTSAAAAAAVGGSHTCILSSSGYVYCTGYNGYGQLGDGTTTSRSTASSSVPGLGTALAITAGEYHTCALTTGGAVYCWGSNGYGQLGDTTTTSRGTVAVVSGLSNGVMAIAAGGYHTCALKTNGSVWCWGYNAYGQLGNGNTTQQTSPVAVTTLTSGIAAIAAGGSHSCAVSNAGAVSCWGYNSSGQLGDNTTTQRTSPVAVSGATSDVASVTAGWSFTCALTTGGAAKCWGNNGYGQLGDNTTANKSAPITVGGLSTGVAAIAAGDSHVCGITMSGGVRCWGYNGVSSLGDGTTTSRKLPVCVKGQEARPVPGDFDGDALSDTMIYRPGAAAGSGEWWGLGSLKGYSWQYGYARVPWGGTGQVAVPGDYDGDGRMDVAVYTSSTGDWWILQSSRGNTTYLHVAWGIPGDIPVPADYDGDGRTDIGIYRPSNGDWWVLLSSLDYDWQKGYFHAQWGIATDVPVPADYDGDGRADVVVFRGGDWFGLYSTTDYQWTSGYLHVVWGGTGDTPVPGDFDGDGRADIGVYRASSGEWFAVKSSVDYQWQSGYVRVVWGAPGQVPVMGDFDGDNKADVTVYTTATGDWYGVQSANNYNWNVGFLHVAWGGGASDVPIVPPWR